MRSRHRLQAALSATVPAGGPALATALALALALLPMAARAVRCTPSSTPPDFRHIVQMKPESVDAQGTITVSCDPLANPATPLPAGGAVVVTVRLGTGQSGLYFGRYGRQGGQPGPVYDLFVDSGRTRVFGDGSLGTSTMSCSMVFAATDTASKTCEVLVFGRVRGRQNANIRLSPFSDTVPVTIVYPGVGQGLGP